MKKTLMGPPALLLGGGANALSVARRLGAHGIPVYALNDPWTHVRYSRFCRWIPQEGKGDVQEQWLDFLTGDRSRGLRGAVVLPCCDDGLELLARHRAELARDYVLSEANDEVLLALLDKSSTYALARKAGVAVPETWHIRTREELTAPLERISFPCLLKPKHSHLFQRHFSTKLLLARDRRELLRHYEATERFGLEMLLTEIIPGEEERYCSYYTYLDEAGRPLFHFTKRKLRQYPVGHGTGTYHMTDWNPEVAELGLRFLQALGVRGLGIPEFKRDARDGQLKLIECNSRFTFPNEILNLSGLDLPLFVYNRLTGRPLPPFENYRRGVSVIVPMSDILAFRDMRRQGELSWRRWLGSLIARPHFLYFRWRDPLPSLMGALWFLGAQFRKRIREPLRRKLGPPAKRLA